MVYYISHQCSKGDRPKPNKCKFTGRAIQKLGSGAGQMLVERAIHRRISSCLLAITCLASPCWTCLSLETMTLRSQWQPMEEWRSVCWPLCTSPQIEYLSGRMCAIIKSRRARSNGSKNHGSTGSSGQKSLVGRMRSGIFPIRARYSVRPPPKSFDSSCGEKLGRAITA